MITCRPVILVGITLLVAALIPACAGRDKRGEVSTVAGESVGHADGTGKAARFKEPTQLTADNLGNLYVLESDMSIRKVTRSGVVTTVTGPMLGFGKTLWTHVETVGLGSGLAADHRGNLYVTRGDQILKINPYGKVTGFAGVSYDNTVIQESITSTGIQGAQNGRIKVSRMLTPNQLQNALALPTAGDSDGTGSGARFRHPAGLAVDKAGNVYVADSGNGRIRKISPEGVVTTLAGLERGGANGALIVSQFNAPKALTVDHRGTVYVVEQGTGAIRTVTPSGIVKTLVARTSWLENNLRFIDKQTRDLANADDFSQPCGLAVDAEGNLYVTDMGIGLVCQVDAAGQLTTLAGRSPGYADGDCASARFNKPYGIAINPSRQIYVAEIGNHLIRIITIPHSNRRRKARAA